MTEKQLDYYCDNFTRRSTASDSPANKERSLVSTKLLNWTNRFCSTAVVFLCEWREGCTCPTEKGGDSNSHCGLQFGQDVEEEAIHRRLNLDNFPKGKTHFSLGCENSFQLTWL